MKKVLPAFFTTALLLSVSSPIAFATDNTQMEKVIVVFKDEASTNAATSLGGQIKHKMKNFPVVTMEVPASEVGSIKLNPHVKSVEKDAPVKMQSQTPDWGIPDVKAPTLWNSNPSFTGKGVKVAVIDTGISTSHPDLSVSGGTCFMTDDYGNNICSATNPYDDDNGHGSHVAGIIGAKNNSIGVVGVAPDSQLYAVKSLDQNGNGNLSDIVSAIDWSITNHMDIINMSLGSTIDSQALHDAIDRAYAANILVVTAAGNDNNAPSGQSDVEYPALYNNAIAVSAIDSTHTVASFSSTGSKIEVSAPGDNVYSTVPPTNNFAQDGYDECIGAYYCHVSGTSMATPYVSGVLSLYKQMYPSYTNTQLRQLLDQSALDLGTPGRDEFYGYGEIQSIPNSTPPVGVTSSASAPSATSSVVSLSWTNVLGAASYDIVRNGVDLGKYSQSVPVGGVVNFTDNSVSQGKNYSYNIYTLSADGVKHGSTSTSVATPLFYPPTPTNFAGSTTDTNATISWTAPSGVTSFEVKRGNVSVYSGSGTSFIDTGLTPSTQYSYSIVSKNVNGSSTTPATLTLTTKASTGTAPQAPSRFVGSVKETNVTLTWKPVSGATSYTLIRDGQIIYTGAQTSYDDDNLNPSSYHQYTVFAGSDGLPSITFVSVQGWDGENDLTLTSDPYLMFYLSSFYANQGDNYHSLYYARQSVKDGYNLDSLIQSESRKLSQDAFNSYYAGRLDLSIRDFALLLNSPSIPSDVIASSKGNLHFMAAIKARNAFNNGDYKNAVFYSNLSLISQSNDSEMQNIMNISAQKVADDGFSAYYSGRNYDVINDFRLLMNSPTAPSSILIGAKANFKGIVSSWVNYYLAVGDYYNATFYSEQLLRTGFNDSTTLSNMQTAASKLDQASFNAYYAGKSDQMVNDLRLLLNSKFAPPLDSYYAKANLKGILTSWANYFSATGDNYTALVYAHQILDVLPTDFDTQVLVNSLSAKLDQNAFSLFQAGDKIQALQNYKLLMDLPGVPSYYQNDGRTNYTYLSSH